MKNRYIGLVPFLIGFLTLMNACRERTTHLIEPPQTSFHNATTENISISPTKTSTYTGTGTPSQSPTVHFEVLKTVTMTPNPTLTNNEREKIIREALLTNLNCELPCWWGLSPEVTKWKDVETLFVEIGLSLSDKPLKNDDASFYGVGGADFEDPRVLHRIGLSEKDGKFYNIIITVEGYKSPTEFQDLWQMYSPSQIMHSYGPPSRVWFRTKAESMGDVHGYYLYMEFEQIGTMIEYIGYLEEKEDNLFVCPRFENGMDIKSMEIYLQAIDNPLPLQQIGNLGNPDDMEGSKRIEKAAGIDENEFYELITQNDQPACFETPRDLWE